MVVVVYVSGISGNKEVKKRQQRVLMILDSKNIKYDVIDITEPGKEADKEFMQNYATSNGGTVSDPNPRSPLPPQLFNEDEYCGDYDQFDLANEIDALEKFLQLEVPPEETPQAENGKDNELNGDVAKESKESSQEKEVPESETVNSEAAPEKENSPAKETSSREATPAKDEDKPPKENTPDKELTPERQTSVEKETPTKEPSPAKEPLQAKEPSPAKEVEENQEIKENAPEADAAKENGTVSSRDHSVEKEVTEVVESKKDPSELLIESEKAAE